MGSNKRVSIIDVAEGAGVSIATVSRVINRDSGYPKETEERVRETIEEYGLTPNVNTIGLRTSHSNSMDIIVPDITDEFSARIIRELDTFLLSWHYSLPVCNSNENYIPENIHIRGLAEKHVDEIIYVSGQNKVKKISEIKNLPIIYIDRASKNAEILILSDNETGGYLTGRELIAKGCMRILFLRDIRRASTIHSRKEGFIRALGENGISFGEELEVNCFPRYEETRGVMERLLREKGCFFDGTSITDGMMALAHIGVLMENQIKMPDRVKVVELDSISLSQFASPQTTTIAQDTKKLALRANKAMLKMIGGREIREKKAIIPVRLTTRGTT